MYVCDFTLVCSLVLGMSAEQANPSHNMNSADNNCPWRLSFGSVFLCFMILCQGYQADNMGLEGMASSLCSIEVLLSLLSSCLRLESQIEPSAPFTAEELRQQKINEKVRKKKRKKI